MRMSVMETPRPARGRRSIFSSRFQRFAAVTAIGALVLAVPVTAFVVAAPQAGRASSDFDRWVRAQWPAARSAGVGWSTYRAAFRGLRLDRDVIAKAQRQPEFTTFIGDYVDRRVAELRIENGRAEKRKWDRWLDRIEARYGVDRHVVLAIWGIESAYGKVLDNPKIVKGTIRSLATLAYLGGSRARYAKRQLVAALKIIEEGDVAPRHMTGSWAGAMGHTQFIPTTYEAYAVDMDGDGKRNIWTSVPDALASTANYLMKAGWEKGKTWGYEVAMPRSFNYRIADKDKVMTLAEWHKLGIRRSGGRSFPRPGDEARLFLPAGAHGPAFLLLRNFRVIKRYNNADAYALAVGHLADRIRGGDDFRRDWPEDEIRLVERHKKELQRLLTRRGYAVGAIDGKLGVKTRSAIRRFQRSKGLIADGHPSLRLIRRLRGER